MQSASFRAETESVHKIQDFVKRNLAGKDQASSKALMHMDLVIEELVVNIVKHGFKDPTKGAIYVETRSDGNRLYVRISDNGIPFNPIESKPPDIEAGITEREPGGLGIFMVKQVAEQIGYTRKEGKNRLDIVIKL